eukprot:scaffold170957_cov14-Tisochrysis_lutea.AAC.1
MDGSMHFCFFNAVNTAARMEQTAGETCIQISSTTYDLLPKHTGIELQPSGGVAMKVGTFSSVYKNTVLHLLRPGSVASCCSQVGACL